jgi:methanol metabolism-related c-type cytochrome
MRGFLAGAAVCICTLLAACGSPEDPKDRSVKEIDGKHYDAEGNPTFKIDGGKVDWYTFSGYVHFTATCLVCHGPDGTGSTFAPTLAISLNRLSYQEFVAAVTEGRRTAANAMPPFRQNKMVMCYLDDLYVYLRARARRAVPHGMPEKHEPKPAAAVKAEDECLGQFRSHTHRSAED